jgi:hypothetical protein
MRVFWPQVGTWPQVYQPVVPTAVAACGPVPQTAILVGGCVQVSQPVWPMGVVGVGHAQCVKGCVINVANTFVSLPQVGTCVQVCHPVTPIVPTTGGAVAVVHPNKWVGGVHPICVQTVASVVC